ncbi:MAG: GH3 auxin-responsive promoter family protein [Phormidesmis sp.]
MRRLIKAFGYLLAPASKRFYTALAQPQQAQQNVRQRLITQLKRCDYGHQFNIGTCDDWHRLPIVDYDSLQPWIAQSTATHSPLTSEPILFYEPTSGSHGPVKHIPYTRSLRRSFNHLFCVWAHDLIFHGPKFSTGKLYFSISPSFSSHDNAGTTDDADYLDPWLRWLLKPFLIMSPLAKTPEAFKENLARTLLQSESLEIVSVWSPSFLTAQLNYIQQHRMRLSEALADRLSAKRARLLCQDSVPWAELWPQLKLVSCWDSATAADGATEMRSLFPNALIQGKGLLATEAPMTVPLIAAKGQVPLLDEVFFEFETAKGEVYELHQLTLGETYEVIISQMGGLYRYRMGDRVQVTHYFLQTPCLKFIGRGKDISDLVGEKLHLQFVSNVIDQLNLLAAFQSLVPVHQPQAHYVLLLDHADREIAQISQQLEDLLCQSFHYRRARELNQLAPADVFVSKAIPEKLSALKAQSGQRWGDIKHARLERAIISLKDLKHS